jgi:hypothetical protein
MIYKIRRNFVADWTTRCQLENLVYHRTRRALYYAFVAEMRAAVNIGDDECVFLEPDDFFHY